MNFMPVIIVAIVMVFVVFPAILFNGIAKVKQSQRDNGGTGSVGMGELESRIQRAVEKANEPLRDEIRALEGRLDAILEERGLPEHNEVGRLPQSTSRGV